MKPPPGGKLGKPQPQPARRLRPRLACWIEYQHGGMVVFPLENRKMSMKLTRRRYFQALWFLCSACYMFFLHFFDSIFLHGSGALFFYGFLISGVILLVLFNYLYICIFFYRDAVDGFFKNLLFIIPFSLMFFFLPTFYAGEKGPSAEVIVDVVRYLFVVPLALIFIQMFFIKTYTLKPDLREKILTCVKAYICIVVIEIIINFVLVFGFGARYSVFL